MLQHYSHILLHSLLNIIELHDCPNQYFLKHNKTAKKDNENIDKFRKSTNKSMKKPFKLTMDLLHRTPKVLEGALETAKMVLQQKHKNTSTF